MNCGLREHHLHHYCELKAVEFDTSKTPVNQIAAEVALSDGQLMPWVVTDEMAKSVVSSPWLGGCRG